MHSPANTHHLHHSHSHTQTITFHSSSTPPPPAYTEKNYLKKNLTIFSSVYTACVNKSASLKEHFFLRKLYVSFVKVYNNMIGNIISFYRIFVLCNLDLWFGNYGKSCRVSLNLVGLIH